MRFAAITLLLVASMSAAGVVYGRQYLERKQQESRAERRRERAIEVAPQAREILNRHCYECHGDAKADRKFHALDRNSLLDANRRNVVPGDAAHSRLIQRIEDGTMPPEDDDDWRPRVSKDELDILKEWIAGGAPEFPPEDPSRPTPPVVPQSDLAAEVRAIFSRHCQECHRLASAKGGIKILNHDLLLQRKVVSPGDPERSEVYYLLTIDDPMQLMPPPDRPRMTPAEIDNVRRWIEVGAPPFPRPRGR